MVHKILQHVNVNICQLTKCDTCIFARLRRISGILFTGQRGEGIIRRRLLLGVHDVGDVAVLQRRREHKDVSSVLSHEAGSGSDSVG